MEGLLYTASFGALVFRSLRHFSVEPCTKVVCHSFNLASIHAKGTGRSSVGMHVKRLINFSPSSAVDISHILPLLTFSLAILSGLNIMVCGRNIFLEGGVFDSRFIFVDE